MAASVETEAVAAAATAASLEVVEEAAVIWAHRKREDPLVVAVVPFAAAAMAV